MSTRVTITSITEDPVSGQVTANRSDGNSVSYPSLQSLLETVEAFDKDLDLCTLIAVAHIIKRDPNFDEPLLWAGFTFHFDMAHITPIRKSAINTGTGVDP